MYRILHITSGEFVRTLAITDHGNLDYICYIQSLEPAYINGTVLESHFKLLLKFKISKIARDYRISSSELEVIKCT